MPLCFLASHILKCPHSIMINDLTRAFEQLMVRKRISISRALKRWGAATQKSVQIFHEIHSAFRRRNYHPHNEAKANMWRINFGHHHYLIMRKAWRPNQSSFTKNFLKVTFSIFSFEMPTGLFCYFLEMFACMLSKRQKFVKEIQLITISFFPNLTFQQKCSVMQGFSHC